MVQYDQRIFLQIFRLLLSPARGPSHVGFPLILAVLCPTHGWLPFAPQIDIPKGFSSKMTLEVAPRGLEIAQVKV